MKLRQGKCEICKLRFVWRRPLEARYAACPICGTKLQSTSSKAADLETRDMDTVCPLGKTRISEYPRGEATIYDERTSRFRIIPWKRKI